MTGPLLRRPSEDVLAPWRDRAVCYGRAYVMDPPEPTKELEKLAKALCDRCPVIWPCTRWVLGIRLSVDPGGVAAGMTERGTPGDPPQPQGVPVITVLIRCDLRRKRRGLDDHRHGRLVPVAHRGPRPHGADLRRHRTGPAVTILKFDGRLGAAAKAAIEPHVGHLYAKQGARILGIVELVHVERTQPAPESEKESSVRMRISSMEIPNHEQEGAIREAQRALFVQRTAMGTLDQDTGEIQLAEQTLKNTAGLLTDIELARLKAGLRYWAGEARRIAHSQTNFSVTEMRHELQVFAEALHAVLSAADPSAQGEAPE